MGGVLGGAHTVTMAGQAPNDDGATRRLGAAEQLVAPPSLRYPGRMKMMTKDGIVTSLWPRTTRGRILAVLLPALSLLGWRARRRIALAVLRGDAQGGEADLPRRASR